MTISAAESGPEQREGLADPLRRRARRPWRRRLRRRAPRPQRPDRQAPRPDRPLPRDRRRRRGRAASRATRASSSRCAAAGTTSAGRARQRRRPGDRPVADARRRRRPAARGPRAPRAARSGATFNRERSVHGLAVDRRRDLDHRRRRLTLGGGLGWLMGMYGLAADNLRRGRGRRSPTARSCTASADEHADLFWALRGGGGNFGVVTSFEFRAAPGRGRSSAGSIAHPIAAARDVLRFYREFTARAPGRAHRRSPASCTRRTASGMPLAVVIVCHAGPRERGRARRSRRCATFGHAGRWSRSARCRTR